MMTDIQSSTIHSDLPIKSSEEDIFSFASSAKEVVDHIFKDQQPESLVVGLSGAWGSGKTSYLNLIENQLNGYKTNGKSVITLRYVPWRVKNRETLLSSFLPTLINRISEEATKDPSLSNALRKGLKSAEKYAKLLEILETGLKPLAKWMPKSSSTSVEAILDLTKVLRTVFEPATIPDIEQLHQEAYEALEKLKIPVLVTIDDIDRLEPTEIVDLLRLVRATAQLPYITFIMSYDQTHVIEAVNKVLNVDGQQFLEKFIQLPVAVPRIAQITLNKILEQILDFQINRYEDTNINAQNPSRTLTSIIEDIEATEALHTPRDIYRIVNTCDLKFKTDRFKYNIKNLIYLAVIETKFPVIYDSLIKFIDRNLIRSRRKIDIQTQDIEPKEIYKKIKLSKSKKVAIDVLIHSILSEIK